MLRFFGITTPAFSENKPVRLTKLKEASIKAVIVLVPTYTAAYLTEKMVWVVPTLAAAGFFAGTVSISEAETTRRIDEDADVDQETDGGDVEDFETEIPENHEGPADS